MLVKIKRKAADLNISVGRVGSIQSFPTEIAELLIANNRADKVEEPKKEVRPKVHTTVVKKTRKRPVKK